FPLHAATVHTHVAGLPAESSRTRRRPPGDARSATAFSPLLPDRIPTLATCFLRPNSDSPVARPRFLPSSGLALFHPFRIFPPAGRFHLQLPRYNLAPSLHPSAQTAAATRRAA